MAEITEHGFWVGSKAELPYGWDVNLAHWIADYLSDHRYTALWDLGCGPGNYLRVLHEEGFLRLCGFEGKPLDDRAFQIVVKQDLAVPFSVPWPGSVVSLEVAEHIPAEHEATFLANVANACAPGCKLVLSWAYVGQPGWGHVNCRPSEYVIPAIEALGFTFETGPTAEARALNHSGAGGDCPWFAHSVYVFTRKAE
jgi:hypothetical protein